MQENSAKIFSDNWSVYQKIVQLNYMYHAEFMSSVTEVFDSIKKYTVDVLDIGCGDAGFLKPVLQNPPVNSYTGYDLSAPALQIAAANFHQSSFAADLKLGDMLELIEQETKTFDIIHAGFAIHHLQDDDKIKMWNACYRLLKTGGRMIYTDIFKKTGVDRDVYLNQYYSMMKNKWTALSAAEYQLIYTHVSQYDFPSDLSATIGLLEQTGFTITNQLEPDNFHIMLLLDK